MKKALELIKNSKIKYFKTKEKIKLEISKMDNTIVLLKGSRGMKLEEIID